MSLQSDSDPLSLSTPFSFKSKLFSDDVHSDKAISIYQSILSSSLKYFMKEYRRMIKAQKKANHAGHSNSHSHSGTEGHSHSHGGNPCDGHHHHEEGDDDDEEEGLSEYDEMPSSEQRRILHALLTIRPPMPIESSILSQLDELLHYEQHHRDLVLLSSISPVTDRLPSLPSSYSSLTIWKGDIITLDADCIVNAANSQLLGCFATSHRCIDNIIHSACGPRLRLDCYSIIEQQEGGDEPEGKAKITRSYHLPSKYIVHTVGPQLPDSRDNETEEERKLLSNCYQSCLNEASKIPTIKSTAFNCISTGLFRFPAKKAAKIAIDTCIQWLNQRKNEGKTSGIERIIFNVFKDTDEKYYWDYLSSIAGVNPSSSPSSSQTLSSSSSSSFSFPSSLSSSVSLAQQWLSEGEILLIAGAAGLSASAGLDYTSESVFKGLYPIMHKRGFRTMYQFIGYFDWSPSLQWGYFLSHANYARLHWPKTEIYQSLLLLTQCFQEDNYFILTSNADGMFEQNGFNSNKIYTIQGDYGRLQCLKPCRKDAVFDIRPFIDRALPYLDKNTFEITNPSVLPCCEYCSGPVMYNVRGGNWFIEDHFRQQKKNYLQFINQSILSGKKIVILEIGVGFNTPSVIRWPMEGLTEKNNNVKLIRINADRADVPTHLNKQRAIGLSMDATEAVRFITKNRLEKYGKKLWGSDNNDNNLMPFQLAIANVEAEKK